MSHQQRLIDAWIRDLKPQNEVQEYLAEHAARCSITLDELREVEAARIARQKRIGPERERIERIEKASEFGHELIDPSTEDWLKRNQSRPDPIQPRAPDLLVKFLEATAEGCNWLADRWIELREILNEKLNWGNNDEYKAIRLLGRMPEDEDNADVRPLRLAIAAAHKPPLPQIGEMTEELIGRPVPNVPESKDMLREICERHIDRLQARAAVRAKLQDENAARHNFDPTPLGQDVRRQHATTHREMMKTLDTLTEMQKRAAREEKAAAKVGSEDVSRETEASPVSRETSDKRVGPTEDVRRGSPDPAETADRRSPVSRETSDKRVGPTERPVSRETSGETSDRMTPREDRELTPLARQDPLSARTNPECLPVPNLENSCKIETEPRPDGDGPLRPPPEH